MLLKVSLVYHATVQAIFMKNCANSRSQTLICFEQQDVKGLLQCQYYDKGTKLRILLSRGDN